MKNENYIRESIDKQIDDNHWVSYWYSNIGDAYSTFTYFEGDICVPEYSKEILHTYNGEKRFKEEEIVPFCKEASKTFIKYLGEKNE